MLLSADLESYLSYFENWANNEPDVAFFLYGGVEFGMDYATGSPAFGYPFVWLEQPEIVVEENDMGQFFDRFKTSICFIKNAKLDNLADQRAASVEMFRLMGKFQKKLLADDKTKGFLDLSVQMLKNEVDKGWAKNHCGWKLEFEVLLNANFYLK
jgi:hypothetical protein